MSCCVVGEANAAAYKAKPRTTGAPGVFKVVAAQRLAVARLYPTREARRE
jgi:hypothetical protein